MNGCCQSYLAFIKSEYEKANASDLTRDALALQNAALKAELEEANAEVVQHKQERLRLRAEVSRLQRERDEAAQVGARAMAGLAAAEVLVWEKAYPTESYVQLRKRILALTLLVDAASEGTKP